MVPGRVPRAGQHRSVGPVEPARSLASWSSRTGPAGWPSTALATLRSPPILARRGPDLRDLVIKFLEHFVHISRAMNEGMWDEQDGFFYDRLTLPDGSVHSIKVRSMVGVLPLFASIVLDDRAIQGSRRLGKRFARTTA